MTRKFRAGATRTSVCTDTVFLQNYVFGTCNDLSVNTIDLATSHLFKITPTLAEENITITWETSVSGKAILLVHDLQGRLVYNQQKENLQSSDSEIINVSDWTSGMYIVQLRTTDTLYSQKIIVE